jgi:hypothetical protein
MPGGAIRGNLLSFSDGCGAAEQAAYSLFAAFATGICLFAKRHAFMRTIYASCAEALPAQLFLA